MRAAAIILAFVASTQALTCSTPHHLQTGPLQLVGSRAARGQFRCFWQLSGMTSGDQTAVNHGPTVSPHKVHTKWICVRYEQLCRNAHPNASTMYEVEYLLLAHNMLPFLIVLFLYYREVMSLTFTQSHPMRAGSSRSGSKITASSMAIAIPT